MKKQNKENNKQIQTTEQLLPEGRDGEEDKEERGVKYMVTEGDLASGSEQATEYTDAVLQSYTPEIYRMLLTNIIPINLIIKIETV